MQTDQEALASRHETVSRARDDLVARVQSLEADLAEAESALRGKDAQLRREYAEKRSQDVSTIEDLQHQCERLQQDIARNEERHQAELREEQRRKASELEQINFRIRQTINRKDETILSLQQDLQDARTRAQQAQQLLDKQRQELLV